MVHLSGSVVIHIGLALVYHNPNSYRMIYRGIVLEFRIVVYWLVYQKMDGILSSRKKVQNMKKRVR